MGAAETDALTTGGLVAAGGAVTWSFTHPQIENTQHAAITELSVRVLLMAVRILQLRRFAAGFKVSCKA